MYNEDDEINDFKTPFYDIFKKEKELNNNYKKSYYVVYKMRFAAFLMLYKGISPVLIEDNYKNVRYKVYLFPIDKKEIIENSFEEYKRFEQDINL